MKKLICAMSVLLAIGGMAFAEIENLFDETLPTQSEKVNTGITFKPKMGTIWGYDLDTNQSGFREVIDIDMEWEILSYKDHATEANDIDPGKPTGLLMFSGGHFMLKIQNESGDLSSSDGNGNKVLDPLWTINFEKLYGKIVWDPFYLLVAASEKNFYSRITGWSYTTANERPRANWAHIGSRVQNWTGALNTDPWNVAGKMDQVNTQGGVAGIGLGYIGNLTEALFQIASPFDWENNTENSYDIGISMESNPVGNLMVQASAIYGLNYPSGRPFGTSAALGYRFDLRSDLALMPHTAMDVAFKGPDSNPFDSIETENSFGIDVIWPGSTGWGNNPLIDKESNIFSGLTIDGSVVTKKSLDKPNLNAEISMHEDTIGGLIPNLGTTFVIDLGNLERDTIQFTYGVYLDYLIWNQYKPYLRIKKQTASTVLDNPVSAEFGFEITAIEHTIITLKYETADMSKLSDNKGLFTTALFVTF